MAHSSIPVNKTIQRLMTEDKLAFKDDVQPTQLWSETFEQLVDSIEGDSEEGEQRILVTLPTGELIDMPARWVERI